MEEAVIEGAGNFFEDAKRSKGCSACAHKFVKRARGGQKSMVLVDEDITYSVHKHLETQTSKCSSLDSNLHGLSPSPLL